MSLKGQTVAVSISNAPDRERLGFPQTEIDRVLFSVCMGLIRAGARVLYAGNLDPSGYTFKIFRHLAGAYASRDGRKPFIHLVPRMVVKSVRREQFGDMLDESSSIAESLVLIDDEATRATYDVPDEDDGENLSRVRRYMAAISAARVIMGGKMGIKTEPGDAYLGKWPGVVEEAIYALERHQPVIALGAFGGASRDAAIALGLLPPNLRVPRAEQQEGYEDAIQKLRTFAPAMEARPEIENLRRLAREENSEAIAHQVPAILSQILPPLGDDRIRSAAAMRQISKRTQRYQPGNE